MSSNHLTALRLFEIDSKQENAEVLVEARKKAYEAEAEQELDEKMGNTLADFQTGSLGPWRMQRPMTFPFIR